MDNTIMRFVSIFFLFIDKAVYRLVSMVYNLFIEISGTTILSNEIIETFGRRLYVLLGLLMLFKVSFSFLNYILNPDSFNDKERGVGKLIQNVLIVLVLIITTPLIFREAMELQQIILEENVLGNVILGENVTNSSYSDNAGQLMASTTFQAFFHIDLDVYPECEVLINKAYESPEGKNCEQTLTGTGADTNLGLKESLNYRNILNAYQSENFNTLLDQSTDFIMLQNKNGDYVFDYMILVPTLAGGFIAYILLLFCIDIAARSVQLAFLQLVAPIPIISRLDPKSSKSGMFSKWFKKCTTVYLDLFIRLIAIYFGVFIISEIISNNAIQNALTGSNVSFLVKVFMILGTLMFVKMVPQLLKDLTGVDLGGKMTLSPKKKVGEIPLAGGVMAAGLTYAGRTAVAATGSVMAAPRALGVGLVEGINKKFHGQKFGDNFDKAFRKDLQNYPMRMATQFKAANAEALGRLSHSKFSGNDKDYSGQKAKDLYASAITGDSSRKGGISGTIENLATKANRSIAYATVEQEDTPGVKEAKGIKATISNSQTMLQNYQNQTNSRYETALSQGDTNTANSLSQELNIDPTVNYKAEAKNIAKMYNSTVSDPNKKVDADNLANLNDDFSKYVARLAQEYATGITKYTKITSGASTVGQIATAAEMTQIFSLLTKAGNDHFDKEMKKQKSSGK